MFCDKLCAYLEDNNLLVGRQYGFRKKSTKLALIDFENECMDAVDAGEMIWSCCDDFSKLLTVSLQPFFFRSYIHSVFNAPPWTSSPLTWKIDPKWWRSSRKVNKNSKSIIPILEVGYPRAQFWGHCFFWTTPM